MQIDTASANIYIQCSTLKDDLCMEKFKVDEFFQFWKIYFAYYQRSKVNHTQRAGNVDTLPQGLTFTPHVDHEIWISSTSVIIDYKRHST